MYADDTTLFITQTDLKDMQENIYDELHNVFEWAKANCLVLNLTRTWSILRCLAGLLSHLLTHLIGRLPIYSLSLSLIYMPAYLLAYVFTD